VSQNTQTCKIPFDSHVNVEKVCYPASLNNNAYGFDFDSVQCS
jgi:hypothetical protein